MQRPSKQCLHGSGDVMQQWSKCEKWCFLRGPTRGSNTTMEHVMPHCTRQQKKCFLCSPCWGFINESAWVECGSWVGVSELVETWPLVSSGQKLKAEEKYQLKPAVRGWLEMVASLWGREPRSRATPAVGSHCQATLVKTVKSLV
jgi:hypothetical protein